MKVLTLDDKEFADKCGRLVKLVERSGYHPDLLVGIANGGVHVMRSMIDSGLTGGDNTIVIKRQRPGTYANKGLLKYIIKQLPRHIADLLRIIESYMREAKSKISHPKITRIELDEPVTRTISKARRILIIDDAVDSGATLQAVKLAIESAVQQSSDHAERTIVRTAVITVTFSKPIRRPDYYLHTHLIRFPWSADA